MDTDAKARNTRRRDLPPVAQGQRRGPRALPSMSSQDTAEEIPAPKSRKKKARRDVESVEEPDDAGMEMGGLASRRESEIHEPLTPEPLDNPPQRKKKKKAQATVVEGDQTDLVSNGDMMDQNTDEEVTRKPKKRKVKPKVTDTQSNNELDVEDDDIITDPQAPVPQHSLFSAPQGQSQPVGKAFVEKSRRFQAAERVDQWKASSQMEQSFIDIRSMWTTRDVSMRVHNSFRVIGLFSHGFLAGYAVWNIIVVYALAGEQMRSLSNLLQQYHTLAYPAQSLLYLLLALSTVSAFDRLNLAKAPAAMWSLLTLNPVALASLLYYSALVLSLSQQMTSDRINLYNQPSSLNLTLWQPGSERTILYPWIIVNLVVSLLVGLAWVLVSTCPDTDHTEEFLMSMEVDYPKAEKEGNITA
ncbi:transmembrane protein 237B-like isoform X2 [Myxocyprinus asiaticus]|uniref:transmembrane protein 237B-like isoform X2 n=1 Tax=Myxocyprinus asiaticus TaxID=70543 RepID=UPI002223DEC4|nr:transmembrane protein 237B-like isoform X2 [Myxocyprinus asiaticus]